MLHDSAIKESPGDLPRKWISDDYFDLTIWYQQRAVAGFQLCYGKPFEEHAFTWFPRRKSTHARIDSGDEKATSNRTPILGAETVFQKAKVIEEFNRRSAPLPEEMRSLILNKLQNYCSS